MHLSGITLDEDMGLSGDPFLKMIAEEGHGHTDAHQADQAAMGRGGRRESGASGGRRDSARSAASGGSRRGSRLKALGLKAHGKGDIKSLLDKVSAEAAAEQQQQHQQHQQQYFGSRRQQQRKEGAS